MRLLKKFTHVYLRPKTPYSLPLHTVYMSAIYLFTQRSGGGGGELNQRVGKRGNSSQSWFENTKMTDCISQCCGTGTGTGTVGTVTF